MAIPEDIITKVRQDFSEDDSLHILKMFQELQKENLDLFSDRILRCLVVLADGYIEKISERIAQVRLDDWRELISTAEYHWGNRIRLLSLPFGVYPDIEAFKQWFSGQQILIPWAGDEKWTIKYSEIRGLSLEQVQPVKNVKESISEANLYFAVLNFLCIQGSLEISAAKAVEGKVIIFYRINPETGEFQFQKFSCNPKHLGKRGKWQ